jgi:hypothetical protein
MLDRVSAIDDLGDPSIVSTDALRQPITRTELLLRPSEGAIPAVGKVLSEEELKLCSDVAESELCLVKEGFNVAFQVRDPGMRRRLMR